MGKSSPPVSDAVVLRKKRRRVELVGWFIGLFRGGRERWEVRIGLSFLAAAPVRPGGFQRADRW